MEQTEQHLCARCASLGRTCCQNAQVFLTLGDVERIRQALPEAASDFTEYIAPIEEDCGPEAEADPVWSRIYDADNRRRVIAHNRKGDCCFLTPKGCRLPEDTRPLVCRLYPYEYNDVTIKGVNGHRCPAPDRDNPALLLAFLGMNRDAAEQWRKTLYREIREEFPDRR